MHGTGLAGGEGAVRQEAAESHRLMEMASTTSFFFFFKFLFQSLSFCILELCWYYLE